MQCAWCGKTAEVEVTVENARRRVLSQTGGKAHHVLTGLTRTAPACISCARRLRTAGRSPAPAPVKRGAQIEGQTTIDDMIEGK